MKNCKCGSLVESNDPNGPICSNSGRFVHACTAGQTEITAQVEIKAVVDPPIDRYSSKEEVFRSQYDEHDINSPTVDGRELTAAEKWQRQKIRFQRLKSLDTDWSDLSFN